MIKTAEARPISQILDIENTVKYFIPKYQREYVWTKSNWDYFLNDIEEANDGHFLGSIIGITKEDSAYEKNTIELVDGQQRMTTITLFLAAILRTYQDRHSEEEMTDRKIGNKIYNLERRLRIEDTKELALTPSTSGFNLADYQYIFYDKLKIIDEVIKPKYFGNRRIAQCYAFFYDRFNRTDKDGNYEYSLDQIDQFLKNINKAILVVIEVATHSDAFTLFETLNNRGVPLSAIDLIKNNLLAELDKQRADKTQAEQEKGIEKDFERWKKMLNFLSSDYKNRERFIRQYYNAFKVLDTVYVEKIPKATKSTIIKIYDKLISNDPISFFDDIYKTAKIYSENLLFDEMEDLDDSVRKKLKDLSNINGVDGHMLLMFVNKHFEISDVQKKELIDFLCKYFVRRSVTDFPPTRDLTKVFMDLIEKLYDNQSYDLQLIKDYLQDDTRCSTKEKFEVSLNGKIYDDNVNATRYILSKIEESSFTKENTKDFWNRNKKGKFTWTIEHVFPQGKNIKSHWVDMIADGDLEKAMQIQEDKVHRLGNLTLTGYNSNLSDKPLEIKQNKKDSNGNYIGFKNGLYLNLELANIGSWRTQNIDDRTELLVAKALEVFTLPKDNT